MFLSLVYSFRTPPRARLSALNFLVIIAVIHAAAVGARGTKALATCRRAFPAVLPEAAVHGGAIGCAVPPDYLQKYLRVSWQIRSHWENLVATNLHS